jgi:ankyrin repeat protein
MIPMALSWDIRKRLREEPKAPEEAEAAALNDPDFEDVDLTPAKTPPLEMSEVYYHLSMGEGYHLDAISPTDAIAPSEAIDYRTESYGRSILHAAALGRVSGNIRKALDLRAEDPDQNGRLDPNVRDRNGKTPMHMLTDIDAASHGEFSGFSPVLEWDYTPEYIIDGAKLLVEAGGDINAKDELGETALHGAVRTRALLDQSQEGMPEDQAAKVKAFVALGADLEMKNADGLTPTELAVAVYENTPESESVAHVLTSFVGAGGKVPEDKVGVVAEAAIKTGNGDTLKTLSQSHPDWKEQAGGDDLVFVGLLHAKATNSVEPIKVMRENGVPFDVRNEDNETPFTVARDLNLGKSAIEYLAGVKRDLLTERIAARTRGRNAEAR